MPGSREGDGPITGLSSMAMRQVLAELIDGWHARGGRRVTLLSVGGVDAARRVREGEAYDFVVLAAEALRALQEEGRLDSGCCRPLARSPMAVAIAAGSPRVRIDTEAAVRDAVLAARSIGSSTGPSGAALQRLLTRWGIAEQVAPRVVAAPPGTPVGSLLARGQADLGFQQLAELVHVPGVEVLGPLPPAIAVLTEFSAGVGAGSTRKADVHALLGWFSSQDAMAALPRHGMEPPAG